MKYIVTGVDKKNPNFFLPHCVGLVGEGNALSNDGTLRFLFFPSLGYGQHIFKSCMKPFVKQGMLFEIK